MYPFHSTIWIKKEGNRKKWKEMEGKLQNPKMDYYSVQIIPFFHIISCQIQEIK
jgi:hypothetical protein